MAIVVTPFAFPVFERRRTTGRHGDDYGGAEFHWQQCMTSMGRWTEQEPHNPPPVRMRQTFAALGS